MRRKTAMAPPMRDSLLRSTAKVPRKRETKTLRALQSKTSKRARPPRRLCRRPIQRNPIRQCRSRNCSAILARASTRSLARRRPGLALILRRRSRATAKSVPAPTRPCAIRSARSAATRRSMWSLKIPARRRQPPLPATNRLPRRLRSPQRRRRLRDPLKLQPGPKPQARDRLLRQRRIRRLPTPSQRVRQPRPTCSPT